VNLKINEKIKKGLILIKCFAIFILKVYRSLLNLNKILKGDCMIKKFKNKLPVFDETCYIADSATVLGEVILGNNVSVWESVVIRGDIDKIVVGENTNIQDGSILHINRGIPIEIGKNVTIGHGVNLHGCKIGNNTLVGIGVIVLNEAIIGENCIIGAGSLIVSGTKIPEGSLVYGSPGKVVRKLSREEIDSNTTNALNYVEIAKEYLKIK